MTIGEVLDDADRNFIEFEQDKTMAKAHARTSLTRSKRFGCESLRFGALVLYTASVS